MSEPPKRVRIGGVIFTFVRRYRTRHLAEADRDFYRKSGYYTRFIKHGFWWDLYVRSKELRPPRVK